MKQYLFAGITEKAEDGSFTAVASTALKDRHGEVVDLSGWDLKNFKKNPVLLWAHDHSVPAIGKATKIWISDGKLMFKGVWQEVTDMGKAAKQLVEQGIINSFSVGFLPIEMEGNKYTKQELLEISLVNVPANPQAQMLAYKSLVDSGIDKSIAERASSYIEKQVVDSNENENDNADSTVKEIEISEPKARLQVVRDRQSMSKVIAKATDSLLKAEKTGSTKHERVEMLKVIKRASELLNASHKGELK